MTRRSIRFWFLVHKWSSLVSTAFLLMPCVTGLRLVFHDEIDAAFGEDYEAARLKCDLTDMRRAEAPAFAFSPRNGA